MRYTYDAWGNHEVLKASGTTDTNQSSIGNINPFRYRGYYYDVETGFYYLQTRYYDPTICRFINADDYELVADLASVPGQLNMYAYCGNNPIMYTDETGEIAISTLILCGLALIGMGLTIGGVATDNNLITAIGLTMVAVPALISGNMALVMGIVKGATLTGFVGGGTVLAGVGTGLFASAEWQQTFTDNNWILNSGMSEGWYNGLMITTASFATFGTFASSFCYGFKIKAIDQIGKLIPSNHPDKGFMGIRFKNVRGSLQSLEIQKHTPHGLHFQLNSWNPKNMTVSTIRRWTWFLRRM